MPRPLVALMLAGLAVAARWPFLISGKIPFDADEAVEGLMARHVLNGELPAFFWGQAFKGVPEVYAAAGAFALFGPSVVVLKSVTLTCFAAYVALTFAWLDRTASRWLAVTASLLLIVSPPALVFWSLDASAEYIIIMLLGTVLLLLWRRLEDAQRNLSDARQAMVAGRSARHTRLVIGLVIGLGLWVHQLFVVYLLPALLILVLASKWWQQWSFGHPNKATRTLGAVAIVYLALSVIAFMTGGFSFQFGPITVSATAPQKMLRIAAGAFALALLLHALHVATREHVRAAARVYWPLGVGCLIGYLPVMLYTVFVEPARSPARVANLGQLINATPDILGNIVPILAGFKMATTERLALPLVTVLPGAVSLAAYVWSTRRRLGQLMLLKAPGSSLAGDFFPIFVIVVPTLCLGSGAYLDTQSYRYLIPWYAGLSVAWASGSLALAGGRKVLATVVVGAILSVHAWQQVLWYHKLAPDSQSIATIDCLERHGIRGGFADYWTSYKLTFLTQEEIIIAPTNGIDRYPRYTAFVQSLPPEARIDDAVRCN